MAIETKEKAVQPTATRSRQKRQPFGVPRSKLSVNKEIEGYHLHWVNDETGRIAFALDGGYTFVEPSEVETESDDENRVRVLAGTQKDGSPMYAYLMKIPMEYHLEDQQYLQRGLDQIDDAIRNGTFNRKSHNDGLYVPEGGISLKRK